MEGKKIVEISSQIESFADQLTDYKSIACNTKEEDQNVQGDERNFDR